MITQKIIFGIDRKEISHFTSIELHQIINDHHTFTIKVPHSVIEKPRAFNIQNSQNWLGKTVHIQLENKNNFLGIITDIGFELNKDLVGNQLVLKGFSKTILLESGQKLHSWEDTTLQDMIREIIKTGADEQLQNDIQPEFNAKNNSKIDYQTQYMETDFQYIQRLAKTYNEWLFYDGEKLFFGKPKDINTKEKISLTFNQDLYTFNLNIQAKPVQFGAFTYNEDINKLYQAKTQHKVEGLPLLGEKAFEVSEKLYNTTSFEYGRFSTGYDGNLEMALKSRQEATMADANYVTATSSNNKLKIGTIVTINAFEEKILLPTDSRWNPNKPFVQLEQIGQYIITEITHKANDIGEYENSFKALPAFIKKLPEPQIAFPQAETQQAIVIDNNDPKKQGRVRVQLQWQQAKNLRSPWIRVMTPDAGSSNEVSKNRGMVFIPEMGDQVMLGFRYNDPNRPFVIGSIFNGTTGAGGKEKNNIKSLSSKSGNIIKLDDNKGSVYISDKGTANIRFDGAGNATTNANVNHNINAGKNNTINAGQTHSVNVGATKEQPPQASLFINAEGNIILDAKTKIILKVGGNSITISKDGIVTTVEEGEIKSTASAGPVSLISTAAEATFGGSTNTNVGGGAITLIVGGEVEVNQS